MKKIFDLKSTIINILNGLSFTNNKVLIDNDLIDIKLVEKCIINYFKLDKFYVDFNDIKLDDSIYNRVLPILKEYALNNTVNTKLTDELKDYLNKCDNIKIHEELKKYCQNKLTNLEVFIYVKELIKDKDLYIYDRYDNMDENEAKEEINNLNKLFNIIDKLDYEINELGIKYKKFDDETFASHPIYLDIYDITFYKRVLDRLNKKLGW